MTAKTFLEFFAGVGLVHLGLQPSGWQCVYANDISAKKREMYLDQFADATYYHCEDIWNTEAVLARIPVGALLATASFPCTDLSLAGQLKGLTGEHSSSLFGFLRVLARLKDAGCLPPLVLVENVTGLLTGNGGRDFAAACQAVAALGYRLDSFVADAKHFTPQSRPRLFIIGALAQALPVGVSAQSQANWRERLKGRGGQCPARLAEAMKSITLPTEWVAFDLPAFPPEQRSLATLIDLDDRQEWWSKEAVSKHLDRTSPAHRREIEKLTASGGQWVGTMFRRIRQGEVRAEVRFDGLAGCLRTAKGGSARQIIVAVRRGEVKMRWMSPAEYARLQGAPDFTLRRPTNQLLTGFGDAVCVPVISWIDHHILTPAALALGHQPPLSRPACAATYQPLFSELA